VPSERLTGLDFSHTGWGDGHDYAFWPMLCGGLFLYVSYYGCDQSQTQCLLASRSVDDGHRALLLNGLLRFPPTSVVCARSCWLIGTITPAEGSHTPTPLPLLRPLASRSMYVRLLHRPLSPIGLLERSLLLIRPAPRCGPLYPWHFRPGAISLRFDRHARQQPGVATHPLDKDSA